MEAAPLFRADRLRKGCFFRHLGIPKTRDTMSEGHSSRGREHVQK